MISKYYNSNTSSRILLLLLLVAIVLLFINLITTSGVRAYFLLKDDLLATQDVLEKLRVKEVQLSREIRALRDDDAYIREQVKKYLYYLEPNEVLYIFTKEPSLIQGGK